jgi:hypothetical protein
MKTSAGIRGIGRRAKIVCTLGPATDGPGDIAELVAVPEVAPGTAGSWQDTTSHLGSRGDAGRL